jgi:hypothetical protein
MHCVTKNIKTQQIFIIMNFASGNFEYAKESEQFVHLAAKLHHIWNAFYDGDYFITSFYDTEKELISGLRSMRYNVTQSLESIPCTYKLENNNVVRAPKERAPCCRCK